MDSILIKNGTVVTLGDNNQILKQHSLLIKDGIIEDICPDSKMKASADKIINADSKIVMPGFINCHTHFYSSFAKGLWKAEPSKNFLEVLNNLWWRLDRHLTLEDCYHSALVGCVDAIKKGTTTLIDHHASPFAVIGSLNEISNAVLKSGLSASLCYEVSDRDGEKIALMGIEENIRHARECKAESNLEAIMGLHASFTIEDSTMARAVEAAEKAGLGFHIHCAEAISDQTHSIEKYNKRVVKRLGDLGVIGEKTILAHGTHLDREELDYIKSKNAILVHNPQSNMNNAVGVADFLEFKKRKILTGIGTDAMTSNMLEEVRSALWIHKLTKKDPSVAFLETTDSLLSSNKTIINRFFKQERGILRKGMKGDVIIVDYIPYTEFNLDSFFGHLVFGISQAVVDTTIASGNLLMLDRELISLDEREIAFNAKSLARKLWEHF